MLEELSRHGYKSSSGTLYPILYGLEKKGYLRSTERREGKSPRKVYSATPLGRRALARSKEQDSRAVLGSRREIVRTLTCQSGLKKQLYGELKLTGVLGA
jgi:DNA-binding PadR family transcriptional regulator